MKRNHFIRMTIVLAVFCLMISGCQGPGGNEGNIHSGGKTEAI